MIYISSACVQNKKIKDSVQELVHHGFHNIELSGGTEYYDGFDDDLLELKEKYSLNYICHNYFPPPKNHFVLNLASLNIDIYNKSIEHLKNAIDLSKLLGAKQIGFHAGFFIDIKVSEIGKKISKENLFDKTASIEKFCIGFNELKSYSNDLNLYVENNVYSSTNAKTYNNENLFMLTNNEEFQELNELIDFNLLLDLAHLKVSSTTLGLNFQNQLKLLVPKSDYIHISDNEGLHDTNNSLSPDSEILHLLEKQDLKNKVFTIEIYDEIKNIKKSYNLLKSVIHG